jgi:hypothetical protein
VRTKDGLSIDNLVHKARAFSASGGKTRNVLDEIKNRNQKILVPV